MSAPTRFLSGVATVSSAQPLGNYPFPDPFHTSGTTGLDVVSYANDFFNIGSTTLDWTIVGTSSTFATTNGLGGVALVTPGGTTTTTTVAMAHSGFQFAAGQKFWYLCRIKMSAITSTKAFTFGLQKGAGATGSATDGLWFTKPASSTSLNLVSVVDSTSTTLVTGVTTVAADTYVDVGFYYDGKDLIVYSADAPVARISAPTVGTTATTLTNALLNVAFNVVPTATDTLSIDYVLAAQETIR
jgi:hypothetical protein